MLVTFLALVLAWSVLTRSSEGAGAGTAYRVQAGDTLWAIADRYYDGDPRQGVWAIQRENGLRGAEVMPGQVLVLP